MLWFGGFSESARFFVTIIMMSILRYLQNRPLHLQNNFITHLFIKMHLYWHTWCHRRMWCLYNNYTKTTRTIGLTLFTTLRYILNWFVVVPICVRKLEFPWKCFKCVAGINHMSKPDCSTIYTVNGHDLPLYITHSACDPPWNLQKTIHGVPVCCLIC